MKALGHPLTVEAERTVQVDEEKIGTLGNRSSTSGTVERELVGSPEALPEPMALVVDNDTCFSQNAAFDPAPAAKLSQLESEARYQRLLMRIPGVACELASDGTTLFVNAAVEEATGYRPEELLGKNWWKLLYPGELSTQVTSLYLRFQSGEVTDHEMVLRAKDGSLRTLAWNSVNHYLPDGKLAFILAFGTDATPLKKSEADRDESEEKFRELFNNANDAIYLHEITKDGMPGRFREVNDIACLKLGYTRDELLTMSPPDILTVECVQKLRDISRSLHSEGSLTFEMTNVTKNGDRLPVEVSSHTFTLRGKRVVLSISRDISERKRAERLIRESQEALSESEARYRNLVELSPDAIVVHSEGKVVFLNSACVRLLGAETPEQIVGKSITDLTHPDYHHVVNNRVQSMSTQGERVPLIEEQFLRLDGQSVVVEAAAMPLIFEGKRAFQVVGRDITERKRVEEALERSEERFRSVAESATNAIVCVDSGGKIIFWNRAAETVFGFCACEVIGEPLSIIVPERSRKHHEATIRRLLSQGNDEGLSKTIQVSGLRKDGTEFPIELSLATWKARGENFVTGIVRDITERRQAEEDLKHSLDRLSRTLEETINAMALTVEMRDPYTAGHQQRVADLAGAIGQQMGLSAEKIGVIRLAAAVHDIGKINVPAEILSKPGRLTDIEYSLIKAHAQISFDILKKIEFPWPIAQIVLQHHERMNGVGYPSGLRDDEILLEARILAVADVVEAMANHRPYRPALGVDIALEEISQNRGVLYDPDVVDACLRVFHEQGFAFREDPT